MSENAKDRGWGDPSSSDYQRTYIEKVTAGGVTLYLRREAVDVFRYFLTRLAEHYPLAGYADDWGYCYRPIRGYERQWEQTHNMKYLSNHSWGLAVDLDSSVNPMTTDTAAHHEFLRPVVDAILRPFSNRLIWGGEYATARKDYMHFEYVGTPREATADSARARSLLQPSPQPKPTPSPVEEDMPKLQLLRAGGTATVWITDLITRRVVPSDEHLKRMIGTGAVDPTVKVVSTQDIAAIKDVTP